MQSAFDQFAKQALAFLLSALGRSPILQQEVAPSETQWMDVWLPAEHPEHRGNAAKFGLLGRMASNTCAFEAFSSPPGPQQLKACYRKFLNFEEQLAKAATKPEVLPVFSQKNSPFLWILSSGRPVSTIRAYALMQRTGWPKGVYFAPSFGWNLGLVVASMLPRTRETLTLRLLGRGKTLDWAIEDLNKLPLDALERKPLYDLLRRLKLLLDEEPQEAMTMKTMLLVQKTMEEYEQELIDEGIEKGRQEGREEGREEARKLIERSVMRRFQKAPRWFSQWLKQQKELAVLEHCLDHVLDAKDLPDLKQRLGIAD